MLFGRILAQLFFFKLVLFLLSNFFPCSCSYLLLPISSSEKLSVGEKTIEYNVNDALEPRAALPPSGPPQSGPGLVRSRLIFFRDRFFFFIPRELFTGWTRRKNASKSSRCLTGIRCKVPKNRCWSSSPTAARKRGTPVIGRIIVYGGSLR